MSRFLPTIEKFAMSSASFDLFWDLENFPFLAFSSAADNNVIG